MFQFKCCGIVSEDDYDQSKWKKEALGGDDLIYPLTCCALVNDPDDNEAYLNPLVRDKGKCMSTDIRLFGQQRHSKVCHDELFLPKRLLYQMIF